MSQQPALKNTDEPWYGIRLIYRHTIADSQTYEERILIIRAESAEEAISEAEALSARDYEDETMERLEYAMAFNIFDRSGSCLGSGTEVFSLMRDSDLMSDEYLDRFHDTGAERSQDLR